MTKKAAVLPLLLLLPLPVAADVFLVEPCRLLDTRPGNPQAANTALEVEVRGQCGIPETALGVIFNLTVVTPNGTGYVKAYGSASAPDTAVITYNSGETVVTTGAMVALSHDDETTSSYDPPTWGMKLLSSQQTDLIVDVTGYTGDSATVFFEGVVTDKEAGGLAPPWLPLQLDTLPAHMTLICMEPWIDPEHCDLWDETDAACGTGHIQNFGGTPEIFVHTLTDCT